MRPSLRRLPTRSLLTIGLALTVAPAAHAADFCVGGYAGCSGTNEPFTAAGFQAALDAAAATTAADRIYLASGTIDADDLTSTSANPVEVIGSGQDIRLNGTGTTILNLNPTTAAPAFTFGGGNTASSITGIRVNLDSPVGTTHTLFSTDGAQVKGMAFLDGSGASTTVAVALSGGSALSNTSVTLDSTGDIGVTLAADESTVSTATILAAGGTGISATAGQHVISRSTVSGASTGIASKGGLLNVRDSLVDLGSVPHAVGIDSRWDASAPASYPFLASRITVGGVGVDQRALKVSGNTAQTGYPKARIDDSVFSVTAASSYDLSCFAWLDVELYSSAWATTAPDNPTSADRCSRYLFGGHIDLSTQPPGFTNAAGHDFTLTSSSPLVDAGTWPLDLDYQVDIAGNPRPYGPASDIGAYELQVPAVYPATTTPVVTTPVATTPEPTTPAPAPAPPALNTPQPATPAITTPQPSAAATPPTPTASAPVGKTVKVQPTRGSLKVATKPSKATITLTTTNATSLKVALTRRVGGHLKGKGGFCKAGSGTTTPCEILRPLPGMVTLMADADGSTLLQIGTTFARKKLQAGKYVVTITPIAGTVTGAPLALGITVK